MEHFYIEDTHIGVTHKDFDGFVLSERDCAVDILVMSNHTFPVIDIEREISGEDELLYRAVKLSGDNSQTVFVGIRADYGEQVMPAAMVAHKGALIDLVDGILDGGAGTPPRVRVYNVRGLAVALLIGRDALVEKVWARVAPDAHMFLVLSDDADPRHTAIIEALAKTHARPLLLVNANDAVFRP